MMNDTIQFIETRLSYEKFIKPNEYSFNPRGRFQWVQRLAWKFLNSRKALTEVIGHTTNVTRHTIDSGKFMAQIFKQKRHLFEHFGIEGSILLIGSEDYMELMSDRGIITQPFSFTGEYYQNIRLPGLSLTVKVVPWMRGMVVMP